MTYTIQCKRRTTVQGFAHVEGYGGAELVGRPASVRKATTVVIERNSPGPWVVTFVACPR